LIDRQKIMDAVSSMILAIGEDPTREGLVDTPRRVSEMYAEFFSGLDKDPYDALAVGFEEDHDGMVLLKDIPFFSICEHHFLPFYGSAGIGYVPNGRVVGASKLARALDILARRPQLQERLTNQLADVIVRALQPDGAAVVLSAEHMCITLRGVNKPGSRVVTSAVRGSIKRNEAAMREFHALLQ
jgi:GTP cyclohydrolase I